MSEVREAVAIAMKNTLLPYIPADPSRPTDAGYFSVAKEKNLGLLKLCRRQYLTATIKV